MTSWPSPVVGVGVRTCPECGFTGDWDDLVGCPRCEAPETDRLWTLEVFAAMERALWRRSDKLWGRVEQRVVAPVPGRNDPCDCGSGRKAKKCCHA